jgi:hypothetical protein
MPDAPPITIDVVLPRADYVRSVADQTGKVALRWHALGLELDRLSSVLEGDDAEPLAAVACDDCTTPAEYALVDLEVEPLVCGFRCESHVNHDEPQFTVVKVPDGFGVPMGAATTGGPNGG